MLEIFTASAGDYLDHWFESAPIKAAFGFDAVVGNYASPYAPGSAYVLLHHCFGEVNGKKGAMGPCDRRHGRDHAGDGERGRARGASKSARRARCAKCWSKKAAPPASSREGRSVPRKNRRRQRQSETAVSRLSIPQTRCPRISSDRIGRWRCGSGTFRMNVALSELPDFSALPGREPAEHHTAGIIIAPSLAYMERRLFRCAALRLVAKADRRNADSLDARRQLAPKGAHVASLFCQHVAPSPARWQIMGRSPRRGR